MSGESTFEVELQHAVLHVKALLSHCDVEKTVCVRGEIVEALNALERAYQQWQATKD